MLPLPDTVRELASRLGARAMPAGTAVRLSQKGRLRQDAGARWMTFKATQSISATDCSFDWRARVGPCGLVTVRDALTQGTGRLEVMALGIVPTARAADRPDVTRGEIMRYLAELPWNPHAILSNVGLRWREESPHRLVVSAGTDTTRADVLFDLDGDGRISSAFAPDRPRAVGNDFIPTPWYGEFRDYRMHDGV